MDASTGYPTASTINLYNIHLHQQRQNQLQQQYTQHQNSHHQFSDPNTTTNTELLWEAHHQHHRKHGNNNKSNYILSPPEDQDCNYRQPQQHYPSEIYYNNDKSSVPNEFYHQHQQQQQQQRENPNLVKTEDPTSLFIDSSLHRQPIITTSMHAREDNISESSSNHTLDSTAHKKSTLNRKQPLKTEAKKRPNVVIEKKRYRRESHNAVERRRRNNINDNIKSLGQLLPDNMREGKLNKGSILKGSVVYIHMLNDQLSKYKERLESLQYEAANLSTISTRNSI